MPLIKHSKELKRPQKKVGRSRQQKWTRSPLWIIGVLLCLVIVIEPVEITRFNPPHSALANASSDALVSIKQEHVLNFESEIVVSKSGSLLVTEKIKVNAEGKNIQRGIYRDISLISKLHDNAVPLEILRVQRDGQDTPYTVEDRNGSLRINIFQEDVYIVPGCVRI